MNWHYYKQTLGRMDWLMLLSTFLLMLTGILFIYSAAYQNDALPVNGLYKKQLVWACVGMVCFIALVLVDYRELGSKAWWIYGIGLILLILVLLIGKSMYGASRWLDLFGIRIQPSEFMKLAAIITVARFWSNPARNLEGLRSVIITLLIVGVPFFLIFKEPDLGTAAILIPLAFTVMFAAGVPVKTLGILVVLGVMVLPFGWFSLGDYQQERLMVFLDPGRDPLGAGWNKMQSEIAVGSGGLTGKGYLNGTQNILGFLPRTVAPTDFIYSVIAEEMGFVGSALILIVFGGVLLAGTRAAIRSRDKLGRLLCVGVITLLFCHVVINVAMTIGLMPITGLPLPLISYGGSFMVSTMMGLGIIQSVYVRRFGE